MKEEYVKLSEAAAILRVNVATLRNWELKGKFKTVRTPTNHRLVSLEELQRILRDRGTPAE